jgi:hypothetical protein
MVAMLGATLFIIASLMTLVALQFVVDPTAPPGELELTIVRIRSFLVLVSAILLALGLVGLYVRQSAATGVVGLISFLITFFGIAMTLASISGSDLVEDFGWALFGVATLQARIYPHPAAILLIIGAIATALISVLLVVLGDLSSLGDVVGYVGALAAITRLGAIAWLGYFLFRESEDSIVEQT